MVLYIAYRRLTFGALFPLVFKNVSGNTTPKPIPGVYMLKLIHRIDGLYGPVIDFIHHILEWFSLPHVLNGVGSRYGEHEVQHRTVRDS